MTEKNLINHTVTVSKEDFGHICRCCLTTHTIANIFDLKLDETSLVDIFKLFGIQDILSDDLPKTICASCTTAVVNFYSFKEMYDKSVAILQFIAQNSNEAVDNILVEEDINMEENEIIKEELGEESKNENNYIERMINDDKETQKSEQTIISPRKNKYKITLPYFCKTCFKWITATGTHKHSTARKGSHICKECGKSYLQKEALDIHYRIHKLILLRDMDEKSESNNSIVEDTTNKRKIHNYHCSCGEIFYSPPDLIQHKKEKNHPDPLYKHCDICNKTIAYKGYMKHMRSKHTPHTYENKSLTCKYCESTFKYKESLDRHTKTIHTGEKFACKYCESTFKSKTNFDRHTMIHTGEKPYVCEFCGKRFIQKITLEAHIRVHTGERPFVCDSCGKGFAQKMALLKHTRSHTGEKPYLCDHCGKTFGTKEGYNLHMKASMKEQYRQHHNKMELHCEICNKIYSSERALKLHMSGYGERTCICTHCKKGFHTKMGLKLHLLTHTSEERVVCDLCGKSFKYWVNLKKHKDIIHTGQKHYSCKICFKAFRRKAYVVSHMRVHSEEKPFACPYCDKSFKHIATRVAHVRSHTGERPYVCDVCSKEFSHLSSMKNHRQRHFKNDLEVINRKNLHKPEMYFNLKIYLDDLKSDLLLY